MTHRVLLVAGSVVERGRLEGSLRNVGHSALAVEDPREAALLCRQFGPSVVLLLSDVRTTAGQTSLALLLNHPATASVPIVAIDTGLDPIAAVTLLKSLAGLMAPPPTGAALVEALDEFLGGDGRDLRRRLSFQRRGPSTLRRIGDHLRRTRASGTLFIEGPVFPARIVLRLGRLTETVAGTVTGPAAIGTLLGHVDDEPWGFAFVGDAAFAAPRSEIHVDIHVVLPDDVSTNAASGDDAHADAHDDAHDDEEPVGDDASDDELAARAPVQEPGLPPLPARHDVKRPQLTMLLVDDDEALITLYRRTFEHAGHVVHTADNGARGYDTAVAVRPDVIVSDIAMPDKNGWDLLSMVRSDPRLREVPFLLLSCHGDFLRGLQKASAGANDYVEKGIRAAALKDRVEAVVEARVRLASWGEVAPPSFREHTRAMGIFAVLGALEKSRADGEVVIDDGWVEVHLHLVGGELVHATARHADGTTIDGMDALVAALGSQEADIEFRSGEAPPGPPTMHRSPTGALEAAATVLADQGRLEREEALGADARLVFKEVPSRLYFLVADDVSQGVARRFEAGASPREVLLGGEVDPLLVEWVVRDLLNKGVAELAGPGVPAAPVA